MLIWVMLGSEAQAQKPAIAILRPRGGEVFNLQGSHFFISVKVQNVTSRSSVGFFLYRNVPESEKQKSDVPLEGPLFETSIDTADLLQEKLWPMNSLACVRDGKSGLCPTKLPPGSYRLEAVLYGETKSPLIGKGALSRDNILAEAISKEFRIEPKSRDEQLSERLFKAAGTKFVKLAEVDPFPSLVPYLHPASGLQKSEEGLRCQKFAANFPFEGHVIACGSEDEKKDIKVGGKIAVSSKTTSYVRAKQMALEIINKKYISRVDFPEFPATEAMNNPLLLEQATYLDLSLVKWKHRFWWVFVYRARKLGGKETGSDRFDDFVTVLVGNEGWSCLLKITPYRKDVEIDIENINKTCGTH